MWNKLFNRRTRFAWASLAVIALALSLFAFPAVRAAASDFLGLFRAQEISVVEVNPAALENLDSAQFESFFEKEVQIEKLGERREHREPRRIVEPGFLLRIADQHGPFVGLPQSRDRMLEEPLHPFEHEDLAALRAAEARRHATEGKDEPSGCSAKQ